MKLPRLTLLSAAAVLLASPALQAQPAPAEPRAAARGCVVAGPSQGDCRALGRYGQRYQDVEGGLREAAPRALAARDTAVPVATAPDGQAAHGDPRP